MVGLRRFRCRYLLDRNVVACAWHAARTPSLAIVNHRRAEHEPLTFGSPSRCRVSACVFGSLLCSSVSESDIALLSPLSSFVVDWYFNDIVEQTAVDAQIHFRQSVWLWPKGVLVLLTEIDLSGCPAGMGSRLCTKFFANSDPPPPDFACSLVVLAVFTRSCGGAATRVALGV